MARAFLILCVTLLALGSPSLVRAGPLVTGVQEPYIENSGARDLLLDRIAGSGSTATRVWLYWNRVAGDSRPSDPANPADPAYDWSNVDGQVRAARARGLRVILNIHQTPAWAAAGNWSGRAVARAPIVSELGLLARAAAERYDGDFVPPGESSPLPEVRDWEVWNEPNLSFFLVPQRDGSGNSIAPAIYRDMVNAVAAAVHTVDPSNNVVAGVLAPFGAPDSHMPLDFMRRLLCMSGGRDPRPVCGLHVSFDVWSHHPYTQGGPTHDAYWPDDVSVGDLSEMRRLLRAAIRHGQVQRSRPVAFWVTEFSWETKGPDPLGVPLRLHARWTSEVLYRMWGSGVSLVTWWMLRDRPFPVYLEQSGFYFCGARSLADEGTCFGPNVSADAPKSRTIRAFRFPFVAFPRNGRVFTWGRTPASKPGRVVIQRRTSSGWRRIGVLRANQYGIFQKTWRIAATRGVWRARLAPNGEASVGFSLRRVPDRALIHPFGCGGGLPC
jgi:hypothetical protein